MLKLVSLLLIALLVVNENAADANSENSGKLIPGKSYHFDSENFPYVYHPGYGSRWVLNSDGPIEFVCATKLHKTPNCSEALLSIHDGENRIMMCDIGTYKYTSKSNEVNVTFFSLPVSTPGSFICYFVSRVQTPPAVTAPPPPITPTCSCGAKNSPTVIAKEPVSGINEFPMMAALVDLTHQTVICGATIINEKQVLTAAQCVLGSDAKNIGVLVGDHDLATFAETNASKFYLVDSLKVHENYTNSNENFNIAIVTIKLKISFSQQVSPVCLPVQHYADTFAGDFVNLVGWETNAFNNKNISFPTTLKKVKLSIITNSDCSQIYKNLTTQNLCTLTKCEGVCKLTKGGPILWENPTTGRLVVVGIIGTEFGCTEKIPFQVNTRVGAFINWIGTNTPNGVAYCVPE